jgi:bifunctional non-homologous end joining protein LigD
MPANSGSDDKLGRYRAKRVAGRTPEPFGSGGPRASASLPGPGRFVVQKHAARRLHYDFRLELGGVLLSWAIPRGPSLDPAEKRMAVMVENHPLEYADFEGVIPEGNYGAGAVIVWDRGAWTAIEDPVAGLESGKLLFDLHGHKLRGRWTLVRTKQSVGARSREESGEKAAGGEWLLIKKVDGFDSKNELPEHSVLSGLMVEEMKDCRRGEQVAAALAELGAPRRAIDIDSLRPMLCETRDRAFDGDGWLFELKLDGFRLLAGVEDGRPFLRYRRGLDSTAIYPEIDLALRSLPLRQAVFDGEVVVFDGSGRPDFGRLQARAMLSRPRDIARACLSHPAHLMVFDLLAFDGYDLRGLPLLERKRLLRRLVADTGVLRYVDHVPGRGRDMYASVEQLGLEGIVGKRADSPYRPGRSGAWVKVRSMRVDDFAVVGWTPPSSPNRNGFSGLHLALRDGSGWVYCGKVGGGFGERELAAIYQVLSASPAARYRFEVMAADVKTSRWVEPRLVCAVRYKEFTHGGSRLRQPVFIRLRDDKTPDECELPRRGAEMPAVEPAAPVERTVALSNLKKVFWPAEGYTKGDLIDYYREVGRWLLPYLADRPLVLTRYPDGIEGKSFYQKDAPDWAPEWLRTESVWSESSEREIHYFVCDDLESLTYVVNSGTIPLHIWSSCVTDLARPDWCILDLDPKGAPFSDVVAVAIAIRRLCEEIELPAAVKTSGSTGLHILIPLARQCTYEQSRTLAGLIVRLIETENPAISTTARVIDARGGKVYLDWLQNRHGQLLVAPLSVRPLPGAPVSMPLRWSEVTPRLDHQRFTIKTALRRLEKLGDDPVRAVLAEVPDLVAALARLDQRMRAPRSPGGRKKARSNKVR